MTGEPTSPAVVRWTPAAWRALGAFLRRPELPARVSGIRFAAMVATLQLFALDLLLMTLLIALVGLATALGFHMPANEIDQLKLGPLVLALIIVILPLGEELVFRSWLSGRPGHIAAALAFVGGVAVLVLARPQVHPLAALGGFVAGGLLAVVFAFAFRRRRALSFFARHFGWFYFAAAIVFALAHLTNYSQGAALILLPLVLPQLIAGLIFGYARVTYGLWSDMLLHMLHNGLLISLVLAQKGM